MPKKLVLFSFLFLPFISCLAQQSKKAKEEDLTWQLFDLHTYHVLGCVRSSYLDSLLNEAYKKDTQRTKLPFYLAWDATKLTNEEFVSLSPVEKFIFAHGYPEEYIQNCGYYERPKGLMRVYATLPSNTDGLHRSERQSQSLQDSRDTTIACLKRCIDFSSHIPLAYKQTLLDLNLWEFIPSILVLEGKMYTKDKQAEEDCYLYSLLMEFMNNNNFPEFKRASFYKPLYGPDAGYTPNIKLTPAVRKQIIDMSLRFYKLKLSALQ